MNTEEIARKALEILDKDGWCKGSRNYPVISPEMQSKSYPAGSHCIGGAWEVASGKDLCIENAEDYSELIKIIQEQYPHVDALIKEEGIFDDEVFRRIRVITLFNDMDSTTEASARAILEKLAAGG